VIGRERLGGAGGAGVGGAKASGSGASAKPPNRLAGGLAGGGAKRRLAGPA
jgi:hypothetical protein